MSVENPCTVNGTKHYDTSPRVEVFLTTHEIELLDYLRSFHEEKWPAVSLSLLRIIARCEDAILSGMYKDYVNEEK